MRLPSRALSVVAKSMSTSALYGHLPTTKWIKDKDKKYLSKQQQEEFFARQNKFIEKKEAKIKAMRVQKSQNEVLGCTFKPIRATIKLEE